MQSSRYLPIFKWLALTLMILTLITVTTANASVYQYTCIGSYYDVEERLVDNDTQTSYFTRYYIVRNIIRYMYDDVRSSITNISFSTEMLEKSSFALAILTTQNTQCTINNLTSYGVPDNCTASATITHIVKTNDLTSFDANGQITVVSNGDGTITSTIQMRVLNDYPYVSLDNNGKIICIWRHTEIYGTAISTLSCTRVLIGPSPNSPPSAPPTIAADLVSISDTGGVNASINFQWNPSTDPDGDPVEYCIAINKESEPNDIPVYSSCDSGQFFSGTSATISIPYEPGETYWWAVWARDSYGNWSEASDWHSYTPGLTFEEIDYLWSFWDTSDLSVDPAYRHSIYGIISTARSDPSYVFHVPKVNNPTFDAFFTNRLRSISVLDPNIPEFINPSDQSHLITPWLDASWSNRLPSNTDDSFNTVYMTPIGSTGDKFEVISCIDEYIVPWMGTYNTNCYFFTYDGLNGDNGTAVTLNEWVDYVKATSLYYGEKIKKLTIIAHGDPGVVYMSDNFELSSNLDTESIEKIKELRTALADDAVILLFSCYTGRDDVGKQFVQNLADWTHATVYANTQLTGHLVKRLGMVTKDWELDVIRNPHDWTEPPIIMQDVYSEERLSEMFAGGVIVEIDKGSLSTDGTLIITNATEHLSELGINIQGQSVFVAYDISLEGADINNEKSIRVTLPIDDNYANIDESRIQARYWDFGEQQWSDLGISNVTVNLESGYITFETSHTTVFAILYQNELPIADAGADIDVEVGSDCIATVALDASGSYDPDGDPLSYTWLWNNSDEDVSILLPYNHDLFSENGFILTGPNPTLDLPAGNYAFSLVVNDGIASSQVDTVNINVVETTPPEINVTASPAILWPPNHKMVQVTPTVVASDNCDPSPLINLISITMNEGDQTNTYDPNYDYSTTAGSTTGDIQVDQSGNIFLRAERSGTNINGRVYTITYSATDAEGNSSIGNAIVTVPHNQ